MCSSDSLRAARAAARAPRARAPSPAAPKGDSGASSPALPACANRRRRDLQRRRADTGRPIRPGSEASRVGGSAAAAAAAPGRRIRRWRHFCRVGGSERLRPSSVARALPKSIWAPCLQRPPARGRSGMAEKREARRRAILASPVPVGSESSESSSRIIGHGGQRRHWKPGARGTDRLRAAAWPGPDATPAAAANHDKSRPGRPGGRGGVPMGRCGAAGMAEPCSLRLVALSPHLIQSEPPTVI